MIIDNADSIDAFRTPRASSNVDGNGELHPVGLDYYVPECSHGQVLFTTKSKSIGEILSRQGVVIEGLSHEST